MDDMFETVLIVYAFLASSLCRYLWGKWIESENREKSLKSLVDVYDSKVKANVVAVGILREVLDLQPCCGVEEAVTEAVKEIRLLRRVLGGGR